MAITDIPIFSMLRTRLDWAQERQRLLAENVANADTPRYQARDLAPLKFRAPSQIAEASVAQVNLARTEPAHLAQAGGTAAFANNKDRYDVRPTGNAVNLEEEMMKVAANQMDYQTATSLYTHSLNLIKVAIGKR